MKVWIYLNKWMIHLSSIPWKKIIITKNTNLVISFHSRILPFGGTTMEALLENMGLLPWWRPQDLTDALRTSTVLCCSICRLRKVGFVHLISPTYFPGVIHIIFILSSSLRSYLILKHRLYPEIKRRAAGSRTEGWRSISTAHQPMRTEIKADKNFITYSRENGIFQCFILQANKDLGYGPIDKMVACCGQSGFDL